MSEKHIYEVIGEILSKESGLTQKGLADKLGLNPAAVNRMIHGMRQIKVNEIPLIEEYLGVKLDISSCSIEHNVNAISSVADAMKNKSSFSDVNQEKLIPVYGSDNCVILDETQKHPMQSNKGGGIAFYVSSENMVPRYFYGEMVYIQRGRPPEKNKDCFIEMKDGDIFLLHFVGIEGSRLKLKQFNPEQIIYIDNQDIKSISAVVGRN